jgi:hypothetical protein
MNQKKITKMEAEALWRSTLVDQDPNRYYFWLGDDNEVYVHEDGTDYPFNKDEDDEGAE